MSSKTNPKVFMNVQIGASGAGRIIFELFNDLTPKTTQNFRGLCTGQYGKAQNIRLHYLNTKIHRIVDKFAIQGGDITHGGGKVGNGYSIYGRTFTDENFARTHSCAGLLSMVNCGRNTNSSQFYITLKSCPHLDGKNIVFGQIIDGMQIIKKISKVPVDKQQKPRYPVLIIGCGQINNYKNFIIQDPFSKQIFQQIKQMKQKIIKDQHLMRKILSDNLNTNQAYQYKKRLQQCQKNLMDLNKRQEILKIQKQQFKERNKSQQQYLQVIKNQNETEKIILTQEMKQKLGKKNIDKFLQLKLRINEAKVLNSKAVLDEQIRQNDVHYHKMIKKQQWLQKRKNAQQQLIVKGLDKNKLYMNRNSLKKQKQQKINQNFGWNIYGQQAYYKAYNKRCQNLIKNNQLYQQQMNNNNSNNSNYIPSQENLQKLQFDIIKQQFISFDIFYRQQKKCLFSRSRMYNQDQAVTYINQRNKVYNKKLQRNFGQVASGIKVALEMNHQK